MSNLSRRRRLMLVLLCAAPGLSLAAPAKGDDVEFFRAVQVDNAAGVQALLARGLDPNLRDANGETGLIAALRYDAAKVAAMLIALRGVDLEAKAPNGNTALMMAAFRQNQPMVVALIERGAQVNQKGWTALHYAASAGSVDITGLLLDRHAYIDAESPSGMTALMLAAREGKDDVVTLLLHRGADATLKDGGFHLTAAEFARKADKPWIAKSIDAFLAATPAR